MVFLTFGVWIPQARDILNTRDDEMVTRLAPRVSIHDLDSEYPAIPTMQNHHRRRPIPSLSSLSAHRHHTDLFPYSKLNGEKTISALIADLYRW